MNEKTTIWRCGCMVELKPHSPFQNPTIIYCPLHAAAPAMLEALTDIFAMIETGELVRNLNKDGDGDWTVKMIAFVERLQKAQQALLLAKGGRE